MTKEALTLALEALYALAAMNHTTQQMKSNAINAIKEALAQPEQEPMGKLQEPTAERSWFTIAELNAWADKNLAENPNWVMPTEEPEREWVGLTGEEKYKLYHSPMPTMALIEEIELKLKAKNNG